MRRYRDMSFANKFRFWVITLAGAILTIAISYRLLSGDTIKASGEAFGAKGGIEIGQAKK